MKIEIESIGGITLVCACGRLDFGAAADFQIQVERALAGEGIAPAGVLIDCARARLCLQCGFAGISHCNSCCQARGGRVCGMQRQACRKRSVRHQWIRPTDDRLRGPDPGTCADAGVTDAHTSVPGEAAHLSELTQFAHEFWLRVGLPHTAAAAFDLALEEVFMNVVMHGSPAQRAPQVHVSLSLVEEQLTLTVADDGPPFDPLALAAPDITANVEERRVGGLGVFLIRQLMDSVSYQRLDARNQLLMTKRLRSGWQ